MKYIYNREQKTYEEDSQYGAKKLEFLYNTILGRILLKIIIAPFFSKINGIYNKTSLSNKKIDKFIKEYKINTEEFEKKDYKSFNDFFIRKKTKIIIDNNNNSFISPADSNVLVYKIENNLKINIKNTVYTLEELIGANECLEDYKNGYCLVFRLAMNDYHRYCFIDDGKIIKQYTIKGKLHTVSSISKKYKVFSENTRVCNYLNTNNFENIIYIEIGALLVGKIINNNIVEFKKGDEKGYFELGGSTIVILTKDNINIDKDIVENSLKQIETKVKYGEKIGVKKC